MYVVLHNDTAEHKIDIENIVCSAHVCLCGQYWYLSVLKSDKEIQPIFIFTRFWGGSLKCGEELKKIICGMTF